MPRLIGLLMAITGLGYFTFLWPPLVDHLAPFNLAVVAPGELSLVFWLLLSGVNSERWKAGKGGRGDTATRAPTAIPGTVEAENYDLGGQGVAFNDSDASNNGGAYRPTESVDIEGTTDAGFGFNVGWTVPGEWIEYLVDVSAGTYDVEVRVASATAGGTFHLELDGVDETGPISFAATGGWQNWITVRAEEVAFDAGVQTLRLASDAGEFNVNKITIDVPVPRAPDAALIFDDMEHGNPFANGWFAFGGTVGGGGIGANAADLPPAFGSAFSLEAGWVSGGVPGFFGGFGRTHPVDLLETGHFNLWINPDAGQDYKLEINLQEDDNGDGGISPPDDDEFQFDCMISATGSCAIAGGGWQMISLPLADFFDDNSFLFGGNGVLDAVPVARGGNGQLINAVVVVISSSGADATFRTDYWSFTETPLDGDGDRTPDVLDTCPGLANSDQADSDGHGRGDVCTAPGEGSTAVRGERPGGPDPGPPGRRLCGRDRASIIGR